MYYDKYKQIIHHILKLEKEEEKNWEYCRKKLQPFQLNGNISNLFFTQNNKPKDIIINDFTIPNNGIYLNYETKKISTDYKSIFSNQIQFINNQYNIKNENLLISYNKSDKK